MPHLVQYIRLIIILITTITLISPSKAQEIIADNIRECRLRHNLTQQGLAKRSGVPLSTLRKFDQQGVISLESLVKLMMVLGMLDAMVKATKGTETTFSTLDEVIALNNAPKRKRGRRR